MNKFNFVFHLPSPRNFGFINHDGKKTEKTLKYSVGLGFVTIHIFRRPDKDKLIASLQSEVAGLRSELSKSRNHIAELEEANQNCISLMLHESRMKDAEDKMTEFEHEAIKLRRQSIDWHNIKLDLEFKIDQLEAAINEARWNYRGAMADCDHYIEERDEARRKLQGAQSTIEKLKQDMNLVVSNAGKDLIAERDQLKNRVVELEATNKWQDEKLKGMACESFNEGFDRIKLNEKLEATLLENEQLKSGQQFCKECNAVVALCSHGAGVDWKEMCSRVERERDELKAKIADLEATEKVYRMNRDWIEDAKVKIQNLEVENEQLKSSLKSAETLAGAWERDFKDMSFNYEGAISDCDELRKQLDSSERARSHTEQWYAVRIKQLEEILPDGEFKTAFYNIMANGIPDAFAPPTYGQIVSLLDGKVRDLETKKKKLEIDLVNREARLNVTLEELETAQNEISKLKQKMDTTDDLLLTVVEERDELKSALEQLKAANARISELEVDNELILKANSMLAAELQSAQAEIDFQSGHMGKLSQDNLKLIEKIQALEAENARLKEIISYLPKVPTQSYEKELAQKIQHLEAEVEDLQEQLKVQVRECGHHRGAGFSSYCGLCELDALKVEVDTHKRAASDYEKQIHELRSQNQKLMEAIRELFGAILRAHGPGWHKMKDGVASAYRNLWETAFGGRDFTACENQGAMKGPNGALKTEPDEQNVTKFNDVKFTSYALDAAIKCIQENQPGLIPLLRNLAKTKEAISALSSQNQKLMESEEWMHSAFDQCHAALKWLAKHSIDAAIISRAKAAELLNVPLIDLDQTLETDSESKEGES